MTKAEIFQELEQRFEVLNRLQAPVWIYDVEGFQMLWANQEGLTLWDAETLEDIRAREFRETQSKAMYTVLSDYMRTLRAGKSVAIWYTLEPKGKPKRVFMNHTGVKLADGRVVMFVEGIPEPPTEHLIGMLENVPLTIALFEANGNLISSNPSFRELLGLKKEENLQLMELFSSPDKLSLMLSQLNKDTPTRVESRCETIRGTRWFRVEGRHVESEAGDTQILVNLFDVTKQKMEQARLTNLAQTDALTKVHNRNGFFEHAGRILNNHQSRFVMYIDLDGFKLINDTLGHALGDKLLFNVAQRLKLFQWPETVLGRIGGDEFVLCASFDQNENQVETAAKTLIHLLSEPFVIQEHTLFITASFGLCFCSNGSLPLDEMIMQADYAMYQAKHRGKNTGAVFTSEMQKAKEHRIKIRKYLKEAVDNQELSLMVQPIQSREKKIHRLECLLRWNHPILGSVSPADFIPIAEESGYIVAIGDWVLRESCRIAKSWEKEGLYTTISVNVSGYQFMQRDLASQIESILSKYNLAPERLEIELTETTLMLQISEVRATLESLQRMGVGISIDDYGTGYSSLGVLFALPINTIKIDRAFVRNLLETKASREIIRSTLLLAKRLDMKVVCEGVETFEQVEELFSLGCNAFQGYYFARPFPMSSFPEWLRQSKKKPLPQLA